MDHHRERGGGGGGGVWRSAVEKRGASAMLMGDA